MGLALSVADLRISGDNGRTILQVDRFSAAPGAAVGVRGPSGAGKSTLLFALAGLANVTRGSVRWGQVDLAALTEERRAAFRREAVGMVFQDYLLFEELTAVANASLAAAYSSTTERSAIKGRAGEMLERLGIDSSARSVVSLSGGERQRVSVARALATDPAIILADEPTASLDRDAADGLVDDLVSLSHQRGKTLIAVSHDPAVHRRMDRLIDIVDGRLVADTPIDA